ncbi:MAG: 4Fe-4S dicluster domain-containing protein [candidate division Zixibacteria bacterium]|nr:4Fe-4S dicluster domain-containing protein [candidate division Zixibacteria bacterium]
MKYGILVDTTKCTSCENCVMACAEEHNIDPQKAIKEKVINKDGLSAYRLSDITTISEGHFARKSCMHCLEPSCVSACLVGGLTKTPEGPVIYDPDKCIGCRYCMIACPFHIPRYEWDKTSPLMIKCDMCFERINQGEIPACVNACPNGALKFGERKELLREAHALIEKQPDLYLNHIWGEDEFGGTSVIYVSDVELSKLGWPEVTPQSIPSLTEPLVHATPFIGLTVAAGLLGINWTIKRRMKLAAENSPEKLNSDKKEQSND